MHLQVVCLRLEGDLVVTITIYCNASDNTYLNMHSVVSVHEVKYSAKILELRLPFSLLIKAKVVTKHEQDVIVLKKLCFAMQLIKQIMCPQHKTIAVH